MTITVKASGDKKAEILIMDVIGQDWFGEGLTAKTVKAELDAIGEVENIDVRINSPGGNVWDGLAIFNLLKQHAATITAYVDGLAASAASLIAMAADTIKMGEGSMMMIHNARALAWGDGEEMRKTADMIDKVNGEMIGLYAARSGMSKKDTKVAMNAETWYTPAEAVAAGLADEAIAEKADVTANAEWAKVTMHFKHTPADLKERIDSMMEPLDIEQRVAAAVIGAVIQEPAALQTVQPRAIVPATAQTPAQEPAKMDEAQKAALEAKARAEGVAAEQARRDGIVARFKNFPAHVALRDACINDPACTVAGAGDQLIAKLGESSRPVGESSVTVGTDARDQFMLGAEKALLMRAGQEKRDDGNEFRGLTLWQLAARALEHAGVSVRGLTPDGIARKVLAAGSTHTTSDFPNLLSSTAGKVLRAAYSNFPNTFQQWCAIGSVSDFKVHPRIQMGSFNDLATIPEGGEYTDGTTGENYENAQAKTKGKMLRLTRQMIVNDDLGGFNRRSQIMGRAAARTVNNDAYAYLTSGASNNGPTSTDTGQVFNATAVTTAGGHANYTGTGTAISTASISLGRKTMRLQKDATLAEVLNILPKVLLCSVLKEDTAWAVMNSITEISQSNPNKKNYVYDVAKLDLVTDPYLDGIGSGLPWYMLADPNDAAAAFEVVFLDGVQEPFLDDMVDFDTDSMAFKVRLDYGVAIGDWRGGYRNAGA